MYFGELRVEEVIKLKPEDINEDKKLIRIKAIKREKRSVYFAFRCYFTDFTRILEKKEA
jgi:site-specific recombinase XerD